MTTGDSAIGVAENEVETQQKLKVQSQQKSAEASPKTKLLWSILTIFCVAISTGYGSQVKYSLLNDNPAHFYPPFTMMWFNNCCLLICFPAYLLYERLTNKQFSLSAITRQSATIFSQDGFKFGHFLAKECFFLFFYVCGNYSYALSLGKISSSAALTIRSFEVSVVYVLGRIVLNEKFYKLKTVAVLLAMAGVILIALDRQFAADLLGVLLILICCGVDSVYKICFKKMAGNASLGQAMLFLSGMAIVNLPANFVPTALLIHYGVDIWQWEHVPWGNLLNFVFLTFVFNIATIFGVALLSPLVISIGVLCGIPISIGMDVIFRGRHLRLGFVFGACSLLASVILVNFHQEIHVLYNRYRREEIHEDGAKSTNAETKKSAISIIITKPEINS